ncbi:DNA polymerase III subunit delta' [Paraburkholderia caribensis]|uniref:DNA polymerase III subunit delta n=1 Tax=Paraburkholderia caribensis TaxID=75105 RepID=A0A9Q6RYZ4_9BURK|nr:DNA polymerase III subunit delta' [Paraburkholderia caribensis]ALP62993.1 DNA polymerase III subunit delta' [Paraburkholderia caribensis]AUT51769.1 DNA polymerase III subunit delta' [Paraburkholderia caribensis]MCO4880368.1 DNA polymerase III subunit delta' [Paraburkholderia caribensis]PTB25929.1 DNA polymerase III subunit delta' [Paraburkholderia caribensis]QLB61124.1 DNA polymerase III subunit delta' [Paraburkholderia caribensis]
MIYPWQTDDWNRLQQLRAHWPHALLLHGQAGIGKLRFAQHLAQGLLCESALPDGQPCGTCAACTWFKQGNHPDYRIVLPEALAAEAGFTSAAADEKAEKAGADADEGGKKTRTPSKEIKIEQVRALLDFCGVGSHRGGVRVVVLYPAEALNVAAANALLKTLEEPPAGVVFLMVSARIDRLLPTIISRCRQWPMTTPSSQAATAWLAQQGVDDAPGLLAEAGGAPLAALALASDENRPLRDWTLKQLAAGPNCDAFACGETLQKLPVPLVLGWLQRWMYDLLAQSTVGASGTPRYFPAASAALSRCASQADANGFARFMRTVTRQRAVENHPLNARLVFEELFLGYRDLFVQ